MIYAVIYNAVVISIALILEIYTTIKTRIYVKREREFRERVIIHMHNVNERLDGYGDRLYSLESKQLW